MTLTYKVNLSLDLSTAIDLYRASTLGARRPVDDSECMDQMLREANLTVTAWDGDKLVGISRSLTDWCYCCYLSDLAVHADYQRAGIGKELVRRTQAELGPKATLILLAAPAAADYYPHIGMEHHPSAWILRGGQTLP
jgi:ribosomal protein S18 acetylase RimI-like enzyme